MRKIMLITGIIVLLLLAGTAFVAYLYLDGLASGWGVGTPAYSWNMTVNSYDELVADEHNPEYLKTIFQTRLRASYKMETDVTFDTVTKENVHITVIVTNVQVPAEATEKDFNPEWSMQNSENRIDDTFFAKKDQSWSITPGQKEGIIRIIKEQVTFIDDADITIVDDLGNR